MCALPCFNGRCVDHECAALDRREQEAYLHTAYGRDQIQRNHPACTAKGSHSGGLYSSCRRDCCLFHSSPGTAVVAVIIGCTVFDVCTVEFCWVYFLFEARVFANVIQARMTVLR